jgi:hypothetical protein
MTTSPYSTRFMRTIGLVVALAATLAPVAQAGEKSDAVDRNLRNNAPIDVRSPDRKFPPRQSVYLDAVDRALMNASWSTPDAVDRYLVNHRGTAQPVDYRSADTRDAAAGPFPARSSAVVASSADGFDWGDAGIGSGVALGLMLLLLSTRELVGHRKKTASALGRPP